MHLCAVMRPHGRIRWQPTSVWERYAQGRISVQIQNGDWAGSSPNEVQHQGVGDIGHGRIACSASPLRSGHLVSVDSGVEMVTPLVLDVRTTSSEMNLTAIPAHYRSRREWEARLLPPPPSSRNLPLLLTPISLAFSSQINDFSSSTSTPIP